MNVSLGGPTPLEGRRLLTAADQWLPSAAGSFIYKAVDNAAMNQQSWTDLSSTLLAGFTDGTDGFLIAPDSPVTIFFPGLAASVVGIQVYSHIAGAFKNFAVWDVTKKGEGRTLRIPTNKFRVGIFAGSAVDAGLEAIVMWNRTYGQM